MLKLGVGINNLHRPPAEHERRTDEHRIIQFFGDLERLAFVGGNTVGRLRNFELVEHRGEELAVLGDFDALWRGADDVDAVFLEAEREVERRLAAELRDGAPALLAFVNVQHVFQRERLEEKLVARVVVGGDGFRVGVDHDGLEAVLLERKGGVDAAVVEFDSLPDAVRPATENHHLFLRRFFDLVVAAVVGRIIIGCVSLELGGAGVHEPVAGHEAEFFPPRADFILGGAGQMGDLPVGKTQTFCFGQQFRIQWRHFARTVSRKASVLSSAIAQIHLLPGAVYVTKSGDEKIRARAVLADVVRPHSLLPRKLIPSSAT